MYQMRHSFASMIISNGENILWVSHTLGHKDSSITFKAYAKYIKVPKKKRSPSFKGFEVSGREREIRTPGGMTLAGFQDQCIQPLCHLPTIKSLYIKWRRHPDLNRGSELCRLLP